MLLELHAYRIPILVPGLSRSDLSGRSRDLCDSGGIQVTIPAGQSSASLSVAVNNDGDREDDEAITITVVDPTDNRDSIDGLVTVDTSQ